MLNFIKIKLKGQKKAMAINLGPAGPIPSQIVADKMRWK